MGIHFRLYTYNLLEKQVQEIYIYNRIFLSKNNRKFYCWNHKNSRMKNVNGKYKKQNADERRMEDAEKCGGVRNK